MKKINPTNLKENIIKLISKDWMLVTAGNKEKFNTMTASWGGIGHLWNKPVAFVFIRPERFTYLFTEENEYMTLSFFEEEYREALQICGTKSGRDYNKITLTNLTPTFTEKLANPTFKEARIVIECRKLYSDMFKSKNFIDQGNLNKWYGGEGELHRLYIVEIVNLWVDE